jgi:hypothetical protein
MSKKNELTPDTPGSLHPAGSAWIDFREEQPPNEQTVLMWFPGLGGTGERGPWVKCDKLRNCIVGLPAFWAHIISPNDSAHRWRPTGSVRIVN